MPTNSEPLTFTVAPLGRAWIPETQNIIMRANSAQKAFKFIFRPETVHIKEDNYKLKNKALDLRKAVGDLLKQEDFRSLASGQLILVTSKPDSDEDSAKDYKGKKLIEQCYFYHDSLAFDESVPYDESSLYAKKTAIVSTYIWNNLPSIGEVPKTNSGRRALEPYLLLSFAMIALSRAINEPLPHHEETRGCPLDYCDNVQDIDRFFKGGHLCHECERFLHEKYQDGVITAEQLGSVKRLLLRASGRDYEYDVALSFAGDDRRYAEQIAEILREYGIRVFYDSYEQSKLWGRDLFIHLHEVYSKKSRFCIMLVSSAYAEKMWTEHERRAAQERTLKERNNEYILPVRLDDTELPGLPSILAYLDMRSGAKRVSNAQHVSNAQRIAKLFIEKLEGVLGSLP